MKIIKVEFLPKYAAKDIVTVIKDTIIYDNDGKPAVIPKNTVLMIEAVTEGYYKGLYGSEEIRAEIEELDNKTQKRTA